MAAPLSIICCISLVMVKLSIDKEEADKSCKRYLNIRPIHRLGRAPELLRFLSQYAAILVAGLGATVLRLMNRNEL